MSAAANRQPASGGAPAQPALGKRGPRPKHIPRRMCVVCRAHEAKRSLVRIVRTPGGTVEIDPTGKHNGRGAYLCDRPACWQQATSGDAPILGRALKCSIPVEALTALRRHAAMLPVPDPPLDSALADADGG